MSTIAVNINNTPAKAVDKLVPKVRLSNAIGFSLPLYVRQTINPDKTVNGDEVEAIVDDAARSFCPVGLRLLSESEADTFWFPLDPRISVSGKNVVVKRDVMKHTGSNTIRGSVKELWSVGDYDINIEGILIGSNGEYPTEAVQRLVNICESREPVIISNDNLNNPLDIQRIVIESYDFPFTKGLNNQVFSIQATSDVQYSLLIKE